MYKKILLLCGLFMFEPACFAQDYLLGTTFPKTYDDLSFEEKNRHDTDGYKAYAEKNAYGSVKLQATDSQENTAQYPQDELAFQRVIENDASNKPKLRKPGGCFKKVADSGRRFIPPLVNNQRVYWWIGGSRMVGMTINGVIGKADDAVLAYTGKGHKWFTEGVKEKNEKPSISMLKSCLTAGDVVIFGFGANDIKSYDKYIATYRQLMSEYPGVTFRFLSVNPVCDSKTKYLKNAAIEKFNEKLQDAFAENFVDTYSKIKHLVTADSTDSEGLHYRGDVGEKIEQIVYNTVMDSID